MSGPLGATPWMYDDSAFYPLTIDQSLKFNDNESQYLSWTPAAAGNRKTWTFSFWVKRGNLGGTQLAGINSGESWMVRFNTSNKFACNFTNNTGVNYFLDTTRVFRDTSAWYHILISCDTTQATASNRIKAYINGELETITGGATSIPLNYDTDINVSALHGIGKGIVGSAYHFDGYLSDVHFIDGQALDATYFGEFKESIWIPKVYNGTYGTNGFHLPFKNDDTVEGFNAVTYTGTGTSSGNVVTGLGLNPDLLWIKRRNVGDHHMLYDSVRYPNNPKQALSSSLNYAEGSITGDDLDFVSDGFEPKSSNAIINGSGSTYVGWAWDAGSGSAASNTDGSITSTVKANPSYGFSVVTASASGTSPVTIGHGLGVQPKMIIGKVRDVSSTNWYVYNSQIAASDYLVLNSSAAKATSSNIWDIAPTSTVFTVGNPQNGWSAGNSGTHDYVFYCFAEVAGYSKISSYSGTGASGNAVTGLGFKPAWLMVKAASGGTGSWILWDNTRDTNDADVDNPLFPNNSLEEFTSGGTYDIQFDSDGFTINNTSPNHNGSGNTYIYMAFADTREAAFWRDTSGNNNNWTPNNLDYRDSLPDSTTNNFAVLQPTAFVNTGGANSAQSLSEGNLKFTGTSNEGRSTPATIRVTSGKYYAEATKTSGSGSVNVDFIVNDARVAGKSTSTTGDIIIVAVDVDAGKYWSGLNGAWDSSGDPATGANPTGTFTANSSFTFSGRVYDTARVGHFNFGQDSTFAGAKPMGEYTDANSIGSFQYEPPANYLSLCTANFPEPEILDWSEYFNTVLYTGNGGTQNITGVGFQPDWVWIKSRDEGTSSYTGHNVVQDSVRGVGTDTALVTNESYSEAGTGYSNAVTAFDSDGFSLGSRNQVNYNTDAFVAWNWKAGGTAVSNTNGSITSQVSANVDAGFSIASYTGNNGSSGSFGHGLGVAPNMVIIKSRTDVANWAVGHDGLTSWSYYIALNGNAAEVNDSANFNGTAPTSTVVNIGGSGNTNDAENYIAYCFANTEGYLKAGSYTGNGSSDGTFVYTGFRPAWIMIKRTDSANSWFVFDNQRDSHNFNIRYLNPNSSSAEAVGTTGYNDFLSNGFKIRTSGTFSNANGGTYIYLAFAENPFKYSNAR